MPSLAQLYKKAKDAGHSPAEIRGKSAAEIQELLNGSGSKGKATKAVKAVAKKKKTGATAKAKKATGTKKRGRPKGSKNSTTTKPQAKRGRPKGSTTRKASTAKQSGNSTDGRRLLSGISYSKTDGWSPREGSAPDRIVKSLKKHKGNRSAVYTELKSDVWDFVGKTKRSGEKRTKDEALDMLSYRIARTDWQFAIQTGQHEQATDRVAYGTGGTGAGVFKRGKATGTAVKKSTGKRGRPAKAQKASKTSTVNPKEMNDAALRKYLKSFEGKRGRRPAEYAVAVKQAKKRKLNV